MTPTSVKLKRDRRRPYSITCWNQPDGIGGGWALCSARLKDQTKRFAVSNADGTIIAWRRTRADAKAVVSAFVEEAKAQLAAARAEHCKD